MKVSDAHASEGLLTDLSPSALARAVEANINGQLRLIYAGIPSFEAIGEPEFKGDGGMLP